MITHLKIKGFKCIEEFEHDLGPFTVLVGPNDSGKSSLMEALFDLGRMQEEFLNKTFPQNRLAELAWRGLDSPEIEWSVTATGPNTDLLDYSVSVRLEDSGETVLKSESMNVNKDVLWFTSFKDNSHQLLDSAGNASRSGGGAWKRTVLGGSTSRSGEKQYWDTMYRLVTSIERYYFDPSSLAKSSPVITGSAPMSLGERGFGLPSVLADMKLRDYARFKRIEDALCLAVGGVKEIVFPSVMVNLISQPREGLWNNDSPSPQPVPGYSLAFVRSDTGWEIPASQSSAGLLLLTAFLTLVHSEKPPSVLLVEEPENGIHPKRLELVVKLLRSLTTGLGGAPPVQVIVSTHSPYLLDFAKADEVLVFHRDERGAARATRMSDAPDLEERLKEQLLGEMWFNVGEDNLVPREGR